MSVFNYGAAAELYLSRRYAKSPRDYYRRFPSAAQALRHIIEDTPDSWLAGSVLEVDEKRYDSNAIRALYDANAYPLSRQQAAA